MGERVTKRRRWESDPHIARGRCTQSLEKGKHVMTRNIFTTSMIGTVLSLVFLGTALPVWCADPVPADRLPVPAELAVADSRKLIRDAFDADFKAARASGEPAALLDRLLKEADVAQTTAKKYAFLLEAEDVAEQHDDSAATLGIVDRRAELFDVDCLAERSKTLARLAGPKIVADLVLLEQATATATKAAAAERFDIAAESANLALKIAQAIDREQKSAARRRTQHRPAVNEVVPAANGVALINSAKDLQKQISKHKSLFTKYEESQVVLATQPDDPASNATAGTYLCFVAQKWDQGLPHLKRSQLPLFSVLARDELGIDGSGPTPKKVFDLAGRWWDAADDKSLTNDQRTAIQKHASRLYAVARPKLSDPLEIRIAETRGAKGLGGGLGDRTVLVNSILAVKSNQTIQGFGLFADVSFAQSQAMNFYQPTASSGLPVTGRVVSGPGTLSIHTNFTPPIWHVSCSGLGTIVLEVNQAGNDQYNPVTVTQSILVK